MPVFNGRARVPGDASPHFPTGWRSRPVEEYRFALDPAWDITPLEYQEATRLRRWVFFELGTCYFLLIALAFGIAGLWRSDPEALGAVLIGVLAAAAFAAMSWGESRRSWATLRRLPQQGLPILPYRELAELDRAVFDQLSALAQETTGPARRSALERLYRFTEQSLATPASTPETAAYQTLQLALRG